MNTHTLSATVSTLFALSLCSSPAAAAPSRISQPPSPIPQPIQQAPAPCTIPVVEYQFDDETDQTNAVVRNHYYSIHNGKILGHYGWGSGVIDDALRLNNKDVAVVVNDSEKMTFDRGLTLEASIARYSHTDEDAILSKWYGGDQFLLTIYPGGEWNLGTMIFTVRFADLSYGTVSFDIPPSPWLFGFDRVTATYSSDTEAAVLRLYWNGVLKAAKKFHSSGLAKGSQPIRVGDANNDWSRFNGLIDEVRVWDCALPGKVIGAKYRRN